jgi:hypothetical protein
MMADVQVSDWYDEVSGWNANAMSNGLHVEVYVHGPSASGLMSRWKGSSRPAAPQKLLQGTGAVAPPRQPA